MSCVWVRSFGTNFTRPTTSTTTVSTSPDNASLYATGTAHPTDASSFSWCPHFVFRCEPSQPYVPIHGFPKAVATPSKRFAAVSCLAMTRELQTFKALRTSHFPSRSLALTSSFFQVASEHLYYQPPVVGGQQEKFKTVRIDVGLLFALSEMHSVQGHRLEFWRLCQPRASVVSFIAWYGTFPLSSLTRLSYEPAEKPLGNPDPEASI